jgi:hypothetical protein
MLSRREMLRRTGTGFGMLGLGSLLAEQSARAGLATVDSSNPLAPRAPHFEPKAKRVIFLFMNGGPSHVDTFDYKPALKEQEGKSGPGGKFMPSPFKFAKYGESGIEMSELYPHLSMICV